MYLAQRKDNSNLPIYVSLFKRLASGIETDSFEEIKEVIIETKSISEGEKDIYTARNEYYYLVSYLLSNAKEFLKGLDKNSIDKNTFQSIAEILDKENIPA